jgi:hypothetical protein
MLYQSVPTQIAAMNKIEIFEKNSVAVKQSVLWQICFEKLSIIFGTHDLGAVTIELNPHNRLHNIQGDIAHKISRHLSHRL